MEERPASGKRCCRASARESGDRLTCTTCHDPHHSPSAEQRVSYLNSRCLTRHGEPAFVSKHHPDQPGLQRLSHAPRKNRRRGPRTSDRPSHPAPSCAVFHAGAGTHSGELTLVGGGRASDRDLGLLIFRRQTVATSRQGHRAMALLQRAERRWGSARSRSAHGTGFSGPRRGRPPDGDA